MLYSLLIIFRSDVGGNWGQPGWATLRFNGLNVDLHRSDVCSDDRSLVGRWIRTPKRKEVGKDCFDHRRRCRSHAVSTRHSSLHLHVLVLVQRTRQTDF